MIFIALGANLPSRYGSPGCTLEAAKQALQAQNIHILKSSRIWLTAPVPVSDQPWFHNAVIEVETGLSPLALFQIMQDIEADFGRVRTVRNAARLLDLDLLTYKDAMQDAPKLILPHPRMYQRGFVLYPLRDIAPGWRHPILNKAVGELIAVLPEGQKSKPLEMIAAE